MRLSVVNGDVVVGDGKTVLEKTSVVIRDEVIVDLPPVRYVPYDSGDGYIDAEEGYIIPGLINHHSHCNVFTTQFFPWSWYPMSSERVLQNLNRHLLQGETTVNNIDGLTNPWAAETTNKAHPVNVKISTAHLPTIVKSAKKRSGGLLMDQHIQYSAEEMLLKFGAVAIGEVGSPATTNATKEIADLAGKTISTQEALAFRGGFFKDPLRQDLMPFDDKRIAKALKEARLDDVVTVERAKEIARTIVQYFEDARKGLFEAVELGKKLNVPVIAHNTGEYTDEEIIKAAKALGRNLIAAHSSHLLTPPEAVKRAREIRKAGGYVDIYAGDAFGARNLIDSPEEMFTLIREGVVDLISTDFVGGYWDPILLVLEKAMEQGIISLPKAISLATGNVTKAVPKLAPERGLLQKGKVADIVIVDREHISKVKTVIIGGKTVVHKGRMVDGFINKEASVPNIP